MPHPTANAVDDGAGVRGDDLQLMLRQLRAIEAWTADVPPVDATLTESTVVTRELRLDRARRRDARSRERAALIDRAQQQLVASGTMLRGCPPRFVLAHRNEWVRAQVRDRLCAAGLALVGEFADGADAAGTVVAEQPELLLVEDLLPTVPGIEVIARARDFAPGTVVGAQVQDSFGMAAAVAAGALAVFTRRIPPALIAEQLLSCLQDRAPVLLR